MLSVCFNQSLGAVERNVMQLTKPLSGLFFILFASLVQATTLQSIDFNSLPSGKVEMRLDFDSTPPQPTGYTIEQPARIALDLPEVSSALKQRKHVLDMGNTQSVAVVEAGGRTRVIVNLLELTTYTTRSDNNSLFVTIGNDGAKDYLKTTTNEVEAVSYASKSKKSIIENIDFRRGEDGEGKVIVKLSDPNVDIDARIEGSYIKLSFLNTAIPAELVRRYDVSDFATPVMRIDAESSGNVTTLSLKPKGEYDYLAYQTDNTYVLSVKPLTAEEIQAKSKEFAYVGDKLSLNFQDIDVRSVLQLIADFTDLNLVASDTVSGKITLRLQNVPWDQALELILKTKGLDKRQVGNVLMVAPAAEIAERERLEIETNKQIEELAPLRTKFVRMRYAKASDLFEMFKGETSVEGEASGEEGSSSESKSILSPRGSVILDARTNSLLITETEQRLTEVLRLIKLIDVPIRQVLIEARIVLTRSNDAEKIGIAWGGYSRDGSTHITGNRSAFADQVNPNQDTVNINDTMAVDLGVPNSGASSLLLGLVKNNLRLQLELSALEATGSGEVVSQPKVITGDKQEAEIKAGQEVPYLESSASGRTTVKFKDVVLKLNVTPQITPDDNIIMDLKINQDSVAEFIAGELGAQVPIINTRELNTQVLVGNGETIVLGGVFSTESVREISKTPFLGDIPVLGRLFKRTVKTDVKTETLIFITPRILADELVE